MHLLLTLILFFVTNIESVVAILKGIYKPHRPKGSGTSRNDEHARKEAEYNRKKQIEEEARLHPPEFTDAEKLQRSSNLSAGHELSNANLRAQSLTESSMRQIVISSCAYTSGQVWYIFWVKG